MVDDLDYLHIERCLVRVRGEQLLKHKSFNFLIQPTDIDIYNKGGVSKCAPPFFTHKAPTFTSWGFVIT